MIFSECLGYVCGPMQYHETPMRSNAPRCGN